MTRAIPGTRWMSSQAAPKDAPVPSLQSDPQPVRVLVVDDDAGIRVLITRILTRHGCVVDAVRDGAEAIEKLREHEYAVILVDLRMLGLGLTRQKIEILNLPSVDDLRTLLTEWAYRQVFLTNDARTEALAPWLEHYNTERRHSSLKGKPPISRLLPT